MPDDLTSIRMSKITIASKSYANIRNHLGFARSECWRGCIKPQLNSPDQAGVNRIGAVAIQGGLLGG